MRELAEWIRFLRDRTDLSWSRITEIVQGAGWDDAEVRAAIRNVEERRTWRLTRRSSRPFASTRAVWKTVRECAGASLWINGEGLRQSML